MPRPTSLRAAILALSAGTTLLAALSIGCGDKSDEVEFGTSTPDPDPELELLSGPVSCSESGFFELNWIEDESSEERCLYRIRLNLRAGCQVDGLRLHGQGEVPGKGKVTVVSPREDALGFPELFAGLSPGAADEDVPTVTWTTDVGVTWGLLSEAIAGPLEVILVPEEGQTCESLSPVILELVLGEIEEEE